MIKKLSILFESRTKALEIIYVLRNLKEVVRHGYYPHELSRIEKFCKEEGLFLVKSKFKVLLAGEDFYSNRGLRVHENHKDGLYFVYISKDEKKALMASYFELIGNDYEFGKLLGFPECCIKHFTEQFSADNPNPEIVSSNPFTNVSLRRDDVVLLCHFPCSADCEESIEIGKKHLEAIKKYDKKLAERYIQLLSQRVDDS